jgi:hypothetical protein
METKVRVTPESPSVAVPTLMVEGLIAPQSGNTKGMNVQFRWVTEARVAGRSGLLSKLLGPSISQNSPQQRTAIQFMGNDVIQSLGITEGVNFNEVWTKAGNEPLRISISEITESEYENLDAQDQRGYQQKINPSTGEVLTFKGEAIYLKRFLDTADGTDEYIQHDGSALKTSGSGDFTV